MARTKIKLTLARPLRCASFGHCQSERMEVYSQYFKNLSKNFQLTAERSKTELQFFWAVRHVAQLVLGVQAAVSVYFLPAWPYLATVHLLLAVFGFKYTVDLVDVQQNVLIVWLRGLVLSTVCLVLLTVNIFDITTNLGIFESSVSGKLDGLLWLNFAFHYVMLHNYYRLRGIMTTIQTELANEHQA